MERTSAAENSAREEALLRRATARSRVAVLDRPALSIGIGVDPHAEFVRRAEARGIPVVPRSTGGSGVLLNEGDLAWAVVLPRRDPRIGPSLSAAYAALGEPVVQLLAERGVGSAWVPSPSSSRGCCLLSGRGRVLAAEEYLLGGAAQHLTQSALLHHGFLPRRVDRVAHRAIFDATDPRAFDRLKGTEELGITDGPDELADRLLRALEAAFPAR